VDGGVRERERKSDGREKRRGDIFWLWGFLIFYLFFFGGVAVCLQGELSGRVFLFLFVFS
jgi:hypothetical protein